MFALNQVDLNEEFRFASDLIERQGQSVSLTGKDGAGELTFLHYLREKTVKPTVVLAPTGVAALNVVSRDRLQSSDHSQKRPV